ncbi:NmrA-like family-domain-containing protein [Talaromyces proteolyticus]|uniref:NmrA-like family-domain-containing protein n=1 Tax=Talaromyces proteolyticus TaxID=1131652 RepID=A0AAD4KZT6_9EURO|nr:NmrA-like family-domain-containing protein [Talaromyces proteolyticus]KAH8704927.1 NmrA-like family-domain-containing protein [Talaromyces proteolyticus]
MAIKNVVVVGMTDRTSPSIVNGLVTSPHGYTVSVLSRESSQYKPPAGVQQLKTDYTYDSLVSVLKGQDAVVSTIAGTALLEQKKIIDAAITAGVQRFIPSEFGSDTSNPLALDYFPAWGEKVEVRKYLESKQDQIQWTAVYNGLFFDWGLKVGFISVNAKEKTALIYPKYKDVAWSATNLADVGTAVAQALSPGIAAKTANQILRIRTVTVSQSELLAALEELVGSKFTVTEEDLDAQFQDAKEKLSKGDFSGVGKLITRAIVDPRTGNNFDEAGNVSNGLLELATGDLKQTLTALL